jgi:parallel beta-helix repeat protein
MNTKNHNDRTNTKLRVLLLMTAVVATLLLAAGTAGAVGNIDSCRTINASNAPADGLVNVTSNISTSTNQCINVTVSDVTLDGGNNIIETTGGLAFSAIEVSNSTTDPANVTVRNVTVTGGWTDAIDYDGADDGLVTGVMSQQSFNSVRFISDANNNTVRDSELSGGSGPGVRVAFVDNTTIENTTMTGNSVGVEVDESTNTTITDSDVIQSKNSGIFVTQSDGTVVKGGTFINDSGADGVRLRNSNDTVIRDVNTSVNTESGISVESESDGVVVEGNTVLGNNQAGNQPSSDAGIYVNNSANIELLDNTVRNNQRAGARIGFADGIEVRDNRVTENCGGDFGVSLTETPDALFVGNNVSNNTGVGMQVFGVSPNLTVRDSKFNDNGGLGGFQDEPNATLVNVTANGNDGYGLSLTQNTTLRDGEARNNTGNGIVADDGLTTLEEVVVADNDDTEVDLDGPDPSTATNLTVGPVRYGSLEAQGVELEETVPPQPSDPASLVRVTDSTDILSGGFANPFADSTFSYTDTEAANVDESSISVYEADGTGWSELSSTVDPGANEVNVNITSFSTFALFGSEGVSGGPGAGGECVDRRDVSRGQESQECPNDRGIGRGESREDLDRETGRDSDTSRRDRGRGERGR